MISKFIKHIKEENRTEWNKEIFDKIPENIVNEINEKLNSLYNKNNNLIIYPKISKVFNFANYTSYNDIKVIILGQDPYHNNYKYKDKELPQAIGLSFSVGNHCDIPPSLVNIYKNLIKYGHIEGMPQTGNLKMLAKEGILLLNTSLTVIKSKPNSCSEIWNEYTDEIIKLLSKEKENLIFVLWGGNALKKLDLIDVKRHKTIISSHPSPLSVNNKLREYESFMNTDHFGIINEYLGENKIEWNKMFI